jgi:hypothetical protein
MTRSGRVRDPEARQVRVVRLIHARPHSLFGLLADPRDHARRLLTIWLPGFPCRMRRAMERSLANLAMLAVEREHHELLTTTVGENRSCPA